MLAEFQTALGRLVRAPSLGDDPYARLSDLTLDVTTRWRIAAVLADPGMQFTIEVQRSWCRDRSRNAAYLTLSMLPQSQQDALVDAWLEQGGGAMQFFASEAVGFLEFIAAHLPPRSHVASICGMERALHLANNGSAEFAPSSRLPQLDGHVLFRAPYASLVDFYAEPSELIGAMQTGDALPACCEHALPMLFAPGLPGLFRSASTIERDMWQLLATPVALREFATDEKLVLVETLLAEGVLATAQD